jgi:hypothetical protein
MSWRHVTAPDTVLAKHLHRDHHCDLSWIEEHAYELRAVHKIEHQSGKANHGLNEALYRH